MRFQTAKGLLNTEQLFDLTANELDALYLHLQDQVETRKGLLGKKSRNTKNVEEQLAIVQGVYDIKVEDSEAKEESAQKAYLKQVILEAAAKKQVEELVEGKSYEELIKTAKSL